MARDGVSQGLVLCPFKLRLALDWRLSDWALRTPSGEPLATSASQLREPLVLGLPSTTYVLKDAYARGLAGVQLRVRASLGSGTVIEVEAPTALVRIVPPSGERVTAVQWVARVGSNEFVSQARPVEALKTQAIGPLVGMAVGRPSASERDEFFGASYAFPGALNVLEPLQAMGLGGLVDKGRVLRDIRLADLDGDGREDVISNVYRSIDANPVNCTLIAFDEGGGHYTYVRPTREDGTCLAGHGETILVADFNGDGRLDIFIPFYERFDLLLNQGGRRFVNVAIERGIDFPIYSPAPEGAAVVDINLDGNVDIVVGNEILLNVGDARFMRLVQPFGEELLFDEGLSVADVDGDGFFDIVKHHPTDGPRLFWGQPGRRTFERSELLLGMGGLLNSSFGLAVADFTGNGLLDLALSGGNSNQGNPILCLHAAPRHFDCLLQPFRPIAARQDLLLFIDNAVAQSPDLYFRSQEPQVYRVPSAARLARYRFEFEVVDRTGRRNQHGRAVRVTCATTGAPVALRAVDGGNGYMAQGRYAVSVATDKCDSVMVDVHFENVARRFGPLQSGQHRLAP
ncbi:hypothetical protein D621_13665 [beta proteobacterium AAP51]|nr:hypothetical protein D621_13665 [beta proteobacterium AAP51]